MCECLSSKLDHCVLMRIKSGEECWHTAYDCMLEEEVLFCIIPRILPADNPQAAETCSHIGLKGNYFCRRCKAGGSREYKESEEGYHQLFSVCIFFSQMSDYSHTLQSLEYCVQ